MHWIYILRCVDDYYYVGSTCRLYRRFWEHQNGTSCVNTSVYQPKEIVAIYKVNTICRFADYNDHVCDILNGNDYENYRRFKLRNFNDENDGDYCDDMFAKNNITECLMLHSKNDWNKIRGGKYIRFDADYKYPNNDYIKNLPLCKCGLPCDIRKNEDKNYLFFRCAKKNMWDGLKDEFNIIDEPCNFFMEYTKDKQLKLQDNIRFEERRKLLGELFKKSAWLKNVEINDDSYPNQCVGGCHRTSKSIKLSYSNKTRNLCFDCFIEKNEELKFEYDLP